MRWLLDLLYGGVPVEFESRFAMEEATRKLSNATRRFAFFVTTSTAVGYVSKDRVSIRRMPPFFETFLPINSPTVFLGKFRDRNGRAVLTGVFTMHWWIKAFMTFWLGFCLLVWPILVTWLGLGSQWRDPSLWYLPLFGLVMFGFGVMTLWFFKWLSRKEIHWLSRVMEDALSPEPPSASLR